MDRFDLEQAIMSCWNTADDIRLLSEAVLENEISPDEISNTLNGVEQMHQLRCQKVFDIFEELIKKGDISSGNKTSQKSLFEEFGTFH